MGRKKKTKRIKTPLIPYLYNRVFFSKEEYYQRIYEKYRKYTWKSTIGKFFNLKTLQKIPSYVFQNIVVAKFIRECIEEKNKIGRVIGYRYKALSVELLYDIPCAQYSSSVEFKLYDMDAEMFVALWQIKSKDKQPNLIVDYMGDPESISTITYIDLNHVRRMEFDSNPTSVILLGKHTLSIHRPTMQMDLKQWLRYRISSDIKLTEIRLLALQLGIYAGEYTLDLKAEKYYCN